MRLSITEVVRTQVVREVLRLANPEHGLSDLHRSTYGFDRESIRALERESDSVAGATTAVVDETIEAVLQSGGSITVVADGTLADQGRVAATLRF